MSSRRADAPFYTAISIDLVLRVLHQTVFHPILVWFVPLAYRAQTFQYHHPPLYLSAAYAALVTVFYLIGRLNASLASGPPRAFDWTEEVALITGGASGLGLLIAEVYGMRGVSVAVLDVNVPDEGETEARNVHFYRCDVGDLAAVRSVRARVEEELGPVTVLINSAAVVHGKEILEFSDDEVARSIAANITAHYNTVREFVPGMVATGKGTVVTMSSVLGALPAKACGLYAPAKAAVTALHHVLTAEMEGKGVKTLLVTPGQMSTELFGGVKSPSSFFAPVLEPVDVAKEVIQRIDEGRGGEVALPLYAKWTPAYWMLPASVRRALRRWSGMDTAMVGFAGKTKKEL